MRSLARWVAFLFIGCICFYCAWRLYSRPVKRGLMLEIQDLDVGQKKFLSLVLTNHGPGEVALSQRHFETFFAKEPGPVNNFYSLSIVRVNAKLGLQTEMPSLIRLAPGESVNVQNIKPFLKLDMVKPGQFFLKAYYFETPSLLAPELYTRNAASSVRSLIK